MVDTMFRAGIAYSFYAVPYSLPTIIKLDRKLISLQKKLCGPPNYTPKLQPNFYKTSLGWQPSHSRMHTYNALGNN
jgi:hypothetical protein